jgi:hypothetical protein
MQLTEDLVGTARSAKFCDAEQANVFRLVTRVRFCILYLWLRAFDSLPFGELAVNRLQVFPNQLAVDPEVTIITVVWMGS